MKVLVSERANIPNGFIKALKKLGHQSLLWRNGVSIFNIFDQISPDLIIACKGDRTPGFNRLIKQEEVIVWDNDLIAAFDDELNPIKDSKFSSDIVCMDYYDKTLDCLSKTDFPYSFKVFNVPDWNSPHNLGSLDEETKIKIISNTKILIDCNQEEVSEVIFIASGFGVHVLTNNVNSPFGSFYKDEMGLLNLIEEKIQKPLDKIPDMSMNTYIDRVNLLLDNIR